MVSISDVKISKKIVEYAKELIVLTNGGNDYLKSLLNDNQKIVDSYNLQNLIIVDITPTEIGCFNSTIKKIATANYGHYDLNLKIDEDKSLLYSYTIFRRRMSVRRKITWRETPLERATTDIFRTEILTRLTNLNKQL